MIVVTVGNARQPFDRLIGAVEEAVAAGAIDDELVVQHGSSRAPRVGTSRHTLDRAVFEEHMERARIVISHAGVGSVLDSLRLGKRPVVMARRRPLEEMVNDHQVELAAKLSALGLVFVVANADQLIACLRRPQEDFRVDPPRPNSEAARLLLDFLGSLEKSSGR